MDSSCSQGFPQRTASYPTIPEPVDNLAAPAACGRKAVLAPRVAGRTSPSRIRSEEHTSELQSLMRTSYAVFCLKKKKQHINKSERSNSHNKRNSSINI